eukprot:1385230-Pyramimonas_sp.AAC.1
MAERTVGPTPSGRTANAVLYGSSHECEELLRPGRVGNDIGVTRPRARLGLPPGQPSGRYQRKIYRKVEAAKKQLNFRVDDMTLPVP